MAGRAYKTDNTGPGKTVILSSWESRVTHISTAVTGRHTWVWVPTAGMTRGRLTPEGRALAVAGRCKRVRHFLETRGRAERAPQWGRWAGDGGSPEGSLEEDAAQRGSIWMGRGGSRGLVGSPCPAPLLPPRPGEAGWA